MLADGVEHLMFLNYFALPSYMNRSVERVTYSTFLNQVSTGDVSEVKLEENQITFVATDDAGDKQVYITGLIDDPTLVTPLGRSRCDLQQGHSD